MDIQIWQEPNVPSIPLNFSINSVEIKKYNKQLSQNEIAKIVKAFESGYYDMAAEYIWNRSISRLKDKILSLGLDFISEMLGFPNLQDINYISEVDIINLAADLGFINKTGKIKLTQINEIINHFSSKDADEEMDSIDSQKAIKSCLQYILSFNSDNIDFSFIGFRNTLKSKVLKEDNVEFERLLNSPYFYKRTTIRTLLNLIKSTKGAELDTVISNVYSIIPSIWDSLSSDDKWSYGFAYAHAVNEGNKIIMTTLKNLFLKVHGFDYVPENLRSYTFINASKKLRKVHFGANNFYNEPIEAKNLFLLGTAIPYPALGECLTSILLCKIGNSYGVSWDAQVYLDDLLDKITMEKWEYYFNKIFASKEDIFIKLVNDDKCIKRWIDVIITYELDKANITESIIKKLIRVSIEKNTKNIRKIAKIHYESLRKTMK